MSKTFSGKYIIKILIKNFECLESSQKGSHVKIIRFINGKKFVTIIPNHKEVANGTLRSALKLVDLDLEDFLKYAKR